LTVGNGDRLLLRHSTNEENMNGSIRKLMSSDQTSMKVLALERGKVAVTR